ncbi:hypothetical protein PFICI_05446 [Pestalotiopsis fici W106-1]|uniref:Uncharacterized protein n=1 Tax=Pestalotiopsis fici (strain W106-1 / CGMCC3.15140) TaxID=1229662 RepID=W3XBZ3_PESFW|nr:uncharacterized protein PFICI_05446 [Pestalotiopsis fici W106-1]ETS83570.1 hypothetical protein PFICI_05446 [Pestalotiopsis fici W106-1]
MSDSDDPFATIRGRVAGTGDPPRHLLPRDQPVPAQRISAYIACALPRRITCRTSRAGFAGVTAPRSSRSSMFSRGTLCASGARRERTTARL